MRRRVLSLLLALSFLTGQSYHEGAPHFIGGLEPGISSLLLSGSGNSTLAAADKWISLSGSHGMIGVGSQKRTIIATPGVLTNLRAETSGDIGGAGQGLDIQLYVNESIASPANTCTITGAGGTEDVCGPVTVRTHVSPGDTVRLKSLTTGTPSAVFYGTSIEFISDFGNNSLLMSNHDTETNAPSFGTLHGTMQVHEATEVEASTIIARPGKVCGMRTQLTAVPGGIASRKFEIRKSGASLTPELSTTHASASNTEIDPECATVAAGDLLSVHSTVASGPAGNTRILFGAYFVADTPGFNIMMSGENPRSKTATQFLHLSTADGTSWDATEGIRQQPTGAFTGKALYIETELDAGAGADQYDFTVMLDTSTTALTCPITSTVTQCNITGQNVTFNAGQEVDYRSVPTDTPDGNAGGYAMSISAEIP